MTVDTGGPGYWERRPVVPLTVGAAAGVEAHALDGLRVRGVDRAHRLPLRDEAVLRLRRLVVHRQHRRRRHVVLEIGGGVSKGGGQSAGCAPVMVQLLRYDGGARRRVRH